MSKLDESVVAWIIREKRKGRRNKQIADSRDSRRLDTLGAENVGQIQGLDKCHVPAADGQAREGSAGPP